MLRAGSGDRQSSEMSCGPNLGSHPFRSITTSSSAALRPRPQARGALEFSCSSRPAALRRLGPGRPRGPCCAPSSLETCWKAGPCQAARGAAQKSQFHLYHVHRARPDYLGLSTGRAGPGLLPGNRRPLRAGRAALPPLPSRSRRDAFGKGLLFLLPLNLHGYGSEVPAEKTVSK